MMEKDSLKHAKLIAWLIIAFGVWSIFSWTRLMLSPEIMTMYLSSMNRMGTMFTPLSLKLNAIGIQVYLLIAVIAGILVLKKREIGRKLLIVALIAMPFYNLVWIVINLILGRKIHLFIFNVIIGIIICIFLIRYLTRPKVKEMFR